VIDANPQAISLPSNRLDLAGGDCTDHGISGVRPTVIKRLRPVEAIAPVVAPLAPWTRVESVPAPPAPAHDRLVTIGWYTGPESVGADGVPSSAARVAGPALPSSSSPSTR
jgi:hypothetical protein